MGNGLETCIWGTLWLANSSNPYVEILGTSDLLDVTMDALMKLGFMEWDEELIRDMFMQRDQDEIMEISLSRSPKEDGWCWAWDKKGSYKVKSGYNFLCSSHLQLMAPTVTNWKSIWVLNVPPKVRNFL